MSTNSDTKPAMALQKGLKDKLASAGRSWEELVGKASQIVLFGSRATGDSGIDSDWDVLLVGENGQNKAEGVDLVWVSAMRVTSPQWLGSELANHIAAFGVWLHGEDTWSANTFVSRESIQRKTERLRKGCRELADHGNDLEVQFVTRRAVRLRRDLQRLEVLTQGRAVPPTPVLDQRWRGRTDKRAWVGMMLQALGIDAGEHEMATVADILASQP